MSMRRSRIKLAPNLGAKTRGPAAVTPRPTGGEAKKTTGVDVKPTTASLSNLRPISGGTPRKLDVRTEEKEKLKECSSSDTSSTHVDTSRSRRMSGSSRKVDPGSAVTVTKVDDPPLNKTVTRMRTKSTSNEATKVTSLSSSTAGIQPLMPERTRTESASSVDSHDSSKENLNSEKEAKGEGVNPDISQPLEEKDKEKLTKTAPRFRSRFPKARPNLAETGRARVRHQSGQAAEVEEVLRSPPPVQRTLLTTDSPEKTSQETEKSSGLESSHPGAPATQEEDKIGPKLEKPSARKTGRIQEKDDDKEACKPKRRKMEWIDGPIDRTKITMRDLIYMNPVGNPMQSTVDAKERKKKKLQEGRQKVQNSQSEDGEDVDDVRSEAGSVHTVVSVGDDQQGACEVKQDAGVEAEEAMPVPQVTIGADGEIILNESSLVINTTKEGKEDHSMELVHEHDGPSVSFMYGRRTSTKMWTERETKKFYLALSAVGTDFSLMGSLFPKRSRTELKRKFKREEKVNRPLIERAIRERQQFDEDFFEHLAELNVEEPEEKGPKGGRTRRVKAKAKPEAGPDSAKDGDNAAKPKPEKKPRVRKASKATPPPDDKGNATEAPPSNESKKPKGKRKPRAKKRKPYDDSDTEPDVAGTIDCPDTRCEDETDAGEVAMGNIQKQTRSGRKPKARVFYSEAATDQESSAAATPPGENTATPPGENTATPPGEKTQSESGTKNRGQFIPLSNLVQSQATVEGQAGSYVFVASKPTVNEHGEVSPQVLHVYLVSPSGSASTKSTEALEVPATFNMQHHPTPSPLASPLSPRPVGYFNYKSIPNTSGTQTELREPGAKQSDDIQTVPVDSNVVGNSGTACSNSETEGLGSGENGTADIESVPVINIDCEDSIQNS